MYRPPVNIELHTIILAHKCLPKGLYAWYIISLIRYIDSNKPIRVLVSTQTLETSLAPLQTLPRTLGVHVPQVKNHRYRWIAKTIQFTSHQNRINNEAYLVPVNVKYRLTTYSQTFELAFPNVFLKIGEGHLVEISNVFAFF